MTTVGTKTGSSARKYGVFACMDTGPPSDTRSYTTVVIVHGFGFSGAVFTPLIPFAKKDNVRLVFVNRRDYFGSIPYTDEEKAVLSPEESDASHRLQVLRAYMKDRASELFDFLKIFVEEESISLVDSGGGIILAGWSFGSNWILALLANISSLSAKDVELRKHIKRFILYDPPYHALGYPPPLDFYNPLQDLSIAADQRAKIFSGWVSGYYIHGNTPSELEYRIALTEPQPTLSTMSPEFIQSALCREPTESGGSDANLMHEGIKFSLFASVRQDALYHSAASEASNIDIWRDIQVRYVWCDRSVWEMPWCAWSLNSEITRAKTESRRMREIDVICVHGANHFGHWDNPDKILRAFLDEL